jgi:hypothetical protein
MQNQDCPIKSGIYMPCPPNLHWSHNLCLYQNPLGLGLLLGGVMGISSCLVCLILLRASENPIHVIN